MGENYWNDMPTSKLIEGYIEPHIIKRRDYEDDADTALILQQAAAGLRGEVFDKDLFAVMEQRGHELYDAGYYMTAKVLWAVRERLAGMTPTNHR